MAQTFFFYDLETSGLNPRQDRIMQFAGQRTNMNLEPIGEPYNLLVTLNDDTLPSPDALMVTGITGFLRNVHRRRVSRPLRRG